VQLAALVQAEHYDLMRPARERRVPPDAPGREHRAHRQAHQGPAVLDDRERVQSG
jgi:hypothetical protein